MNNSGNGLGRDKPNYQFKRELKPRHVNMIAIGGSIGTGIFVALGSSLSQAGPGGTLVAYGVIGIMVYFLMTSLGEMATYLPVSGSFETYATRFVDPALGFALGWNYWYMSAATLASELVAAALVMKFWFPDSHAFFWWGIFWLLLLGLNLFSARMYGESEFWFAGIKVTTIIIFLVVGFFMIIGALGDHQVGFENWTRGEAPFVGGTGSILGIFMIAGYSFLGTEVVGITAGESENPEKNVPRAIKSVFWRILLFYVGSIVVVSFLIPYDDPNLLTSDLENIAVSPFTLVFKRAGLTAAAGIMNAIILTSVLSCGNSMLYAGSRMLCALANEGKAPKSIGKITKKGVPLNALLVTAAIGLLAFLTSFAGEGEVYNWLINASGLVGFISWLGIAVSHYRFRKAMKAQNVPLSELKFKALGFPFGPIFSFVLCMIVIIGQGSFAISGGSIDWLGMLVTFGSVPLFIVLWVGYKVVTKSRLIPYDKVDLRRHSNMNDSI